jgi:hypothetical protein
MEFPTASCCFMSLTSKYLGTFFSDTLSLRHSLMTVDQVPCPMINLCDLMLIFINQQGKMKYSKLNINKHFQTNSYYGNFRVNEQDLFNRVHHFPCIFTRPFP